MSIKSIDDLMRFSGRRVWCVRHIVIPDLSYHSGLGGAIETNRSVMTEWHVGPFIRLRLPFLRARGATIDPTPFEVADRFGGNSAKSIFYNVDFVDAKRCLREAKVLALEAYIPDSSLSHAIVPPPGRSAVFATEEEAQSRQVFIALSGDPVRRQDERYDLEQVGVSVETMPDDLYSRTGRWATGSSA